MELEVKKRRAQLHKRQGIGAGICILAVAYLFYMVFGIDSYYIEWAFGLGISILVTYSIGIVYALLLAAACLIIRSGSLKIAEILNTECDPFLYEACISRDSMWLHQDKSLCNLALAQHYQGDFDRAWDTLQRIRAHKLKGGIFKANYYILLSDQYFRRGMGMQVRELEEAFRLSMPNPNGIRGKREQKYFEMLCAGNNLIRALENKDYPSAVKFLEDRIELNGSTSRPWMQVSYAFKEAQIYIGLGEKESARLKLQYVVSKGNRLWCVNEAQRLLAEMEGDNKDEEMQQEQSGLNSKTESETMIDQNN